jgi:hypothetical protein
MEPPRSRPGPQGFSKRVRAVCFAGMAVTLACVGCSGSGTGDGPSTSEGSAPSIRCGSNAGGSGRNVGSKPQNGLAAVDPANFALPVDNPYFPLEPGTTYRHEGMAEGEPAAIAYTVTHQTRTILGVTNLIVLDTLYVNGRIEEITHDWYTQDCQGNVWYFGEAIKEYDPNGHRIPAKGAWQAGVDGAKPGIVMPAEPKVGMVFRPEFYKGEAEDRYEIRDLSAEVRTPYGMFSDVLVMTEQTRLEPGVLGLKYHAPGYGQIKESVAKGPPETLRLVSVKHRD